MGIIWALPTLNCISLGKWKTKAYYNVNFIEIFPKNQIHLNSVTSTIIVVFSHTHTQPNWYVLKYTNWYEIINNRENKRTRMYICIVNMFIKHILELIWKGSIKSEQTKWMVKDIKCWKNKFTVADITRGIQYKVWSKISIFIWVNIQLDAGAH